jgi:hypothetical protein
MIKNLIRKNKLLTKILTPAYRYIIRFPRRLGYYKSPKMLRGELNLFKAIYMQCKTIVDVGTRFDVDYVAISQGNNINYFLFEANPRFYKRLILNLKPFKENVFSENLAIGGKNGFVDYYVDSESIYKNWATGGGIQSKNLKNL